MCGQEVNLKGTITMIIDVHTHLNNYDEEKHRPIEVCLEAMLETMQENHVDHAMVLTSYKVNEHRPSTAQVVEATEEHPSLHVVAGISYLNYRERDLRELADYLKDGRVIGLKLYPGYEPFYPYDKRCQVIYDLAVEFDVPVMFHSGDTYSPKGKLRYAHPLNIDDVAVDNPDMKIVICHVGNPWVRDCMEVVYKNKNVYADISGLVLGNFTSHFEEFMRNQLRDMILYAGEPRYLLYGTDWPISNMGTYIDFMNNLQISERDRDRIFWENAAHLFKLKIARELPTDIGRK